MNEQDKNLNFIMNKPIGVVGVNFNTINDTLFRNIGYVSGDYDGYGTPIGALANPMHNTMRYIPWFKLDNYKDVFSTYMDYVEHVLVTQNLVIERLFTEPKSPLTPYRIYNDKIAAIEGYDIVNAVFSSDTNMVLDTKLGQVNNFYLSHDLLTTSQVNTERLFTNKNETRKSITNTLYPNFGLFNQNLKEITKKWNFDEKGRVYVGLGLDGSPVYDLDGILGNLTEEKYKPWLDTLGNESLLFLTKSLNNIPLTDDSVYDVYGRTELINRGIIEQVRERSYLNKLGTDISFTPNYSEAFYRYELQGTKNDTFDGQITHHTYAEFEMGGEKTTSSYDGMLNGTYTSYLDDESIHKDLIGITNQAFRAGAYGTLISRFCSDANAQGFQPTTIQTSVSEYGMSHGRNLLKCNPTQEQDYIDPYCRVWTHYKKYHRLADAIRPFSENGEKQDEMKLVSQGELASKYGWNMFSSTNLGDGWEDGRKRLDKYGTLNKINGMINIAPTNKQQDKDDAVSIKECMFSIENLAWKGLRDKAFGLSEEQKGPFGGRVMWFPPYDLQFSENVSVNWNNTSFIGRGEDIYTYTNTTRRGNLSFTILADHPSIVNYMSKSNCGDLKKDENDEPIEGSGLSSKNEIHTKEQALLRFFAGCDILHASKPINNIKFEEKYPTFPQIPQEEPIAEPPSTNTIYEDINFFVFYPNNYSGVDDKPTNDVKAMDYLVNGLCTQLMVTSDNKIATIPTMPKEAYIYNGRSVGGYEMGRNGVSVVQTETLTNNKTEKVLSGVKGGRNLNVTINEGYGDIKLATQFVSPNKFNGTSEWYYRVDRVYEGQKLIKGNYVDNKDFGLNMKDGRNIILSTLVSGSDSPITSDNLYSFIDVYSALDEEMYKAMSQEGKVDEENYKKLKNLFQNYQIESVQGQGVASSHGYTSSNNQLNKNRCNSVFDWLKTFNNFSSASFSVESPYIGNVSSGVNKTQSVNDKYAKLYRSAKITIKLQKEETVTLQNTMKGDEETMTSTENGEVVKTKYGDVYVPYKVLTSVNDQSRNGDSIDFKKRTELIERYLFENPHQFFENETEELKAAIAAWKNEVMNVAKSNMYETNVSNSHNRYDNESDFFRTLKLTDPFLHHKIVDKIKYFDPAFHSITPEGFNARLTFLQQCSRQGGTYSANEDGMNSGNANNLAFGRPPICVLNIGSFYSTKIIIDNINIDYESWDLNQEGIGVQPMMAKINMSFIFLGGQDLGGPIARLQNAVSFNYYKNTSVYDNRSEMIEYDENGNVKRFRGVK